MNTKKGFTLVELMVIIVIFGIVAAVVAAVVVPIAMGKQIPRGHHCTHSNNW